MFHVTCYMYRVQLFDVAVSLLPGLGPKEIDILFEQMKHALKVHLVLVFIMSWEIIHSLDLIEYPTKYILLAGC